MLCSWKQGNFNGNYYDKGLNNKEVDGATAMERFYGIQDGTEDWSVPFVGMNDIDASKKVYASIGKNFNDMSPWEFDVTELVTQWVLNPELNYGVLLRSPTDQGLDDKNLSYPDLVSGDNLDLPAKRPMLKITFRK
jgi:hypothetical protein